MSRFRYLYANNKAQPVNSIKRFKPSLFPQLVFLCALFFSIDSTASECKVGDTIMAANNQLAPFFFVDENQQNTGIVYDLSSKLAQLMGSNVCVRGMNWAEAQLALQEGEVHALLHINKTPSRDLLYDFSTPFLASQFVYFTVRSRKNELYENSFFNAHIGVEEKGLPYDYMSSKNLPFEIISSWREGLQLVAQDKLDAVLVDRLVGFNASIEARTPNLAMVRSEIPPSFSRIAVMKGNDVLLERINLALSQLATSGEIDRVVQSWISPQIEHVESLWYEYGQAESLNKLLIFVILTACLALVYAVKRVFDLKRTQGELEAHQLASSRVISDLRVEQVELRKDSVNRQLQRANSAESINLALGGIKRGIDVLKENRSSGKSSSELMRWINTPLSHAMAHSLKLQTAQDAITEKDASTLDVDVFVQRILAIASPQRCSYSVTPKVRLEGREQAIKLLISCLLELSLKHYKPHMQTRVELQFRRDDQGTRLIYSDNTSGLNNPLYLPIEVLLDPSDPRSSVKLLSSSLAENLKLFSEIGFNIDLLETEERQLGGSTFSVLLTDVSSASI